MLAGVSGCLVCGSALFAFHGTARAQGAPKTGVAVKVIVIEAPFRATGGKDELLKAGGSIVLEPFVRTLDGMSADVTESKAVSYSVLTGDKSSPDRQATVTVGWTLKTIPHVNADGTIQLDVDVTDTELAPGGPPATMRQGLFNSLRLKDGNVARFGEWSRGSKIFAVFASASIYPGN